jgi:hypothetical protein
MIPSVGAIGSVFLPCRKSANTSRSNVAVVDGEVSGLSILPWIGLNLLDHVSAGLATDEEPGLGHGLCRCRSCQRPLGCLPVYGFSVLIRISRGLGMAYFQTPRQSSGASLRHKVRALGSSSACAYYI